MTNLGISLPNAIAFNILWLLGMWQAIFIRCVRCNPLLGMCSFYCTFIMHVFVAWGGGFTPPIWLKRADYEVAYDRIGLWDLSEWFANKPDGDVVWLRVNWEVRLPRWADSAVDSREPKEKLTPCFAQFVSFSKDLLIKRWTISNITRLLTMMMHSFQYISVPHSTIHIFEFNESLSYRLGRNYCIYCWLVFGYFCWLIMRFVRHKSMSDIFLTKACIKTYNMMTASHQ